jgi:hypothetical protein
MSTQTFVLELPNCDVCVGITKAYADVKIPGGPWGFICKTHFKLHGCELGTGKGQELIEAPRDPMVGKVHDRRPLDL